MALPISYHRRKFSAAAAIIAAALLVCAVALSGRHLEKTELAVDTQTLADGLQIEDIEIGSGQSPQIGDKIKVHYTGKLVSGEVFDSGDISFQFGEGQVIKGWDEGLKGMKVGGQRKLVIPPSLGYGHAGTPGGPIPPDAVLHFDVKLLSV
mmetsp:Transcript_39650/g.97456  ORF Transcript_39650/g.97456 Transcript_39650/m.97456 type:complete len:151 (-) Transcript_39650:464-916(-)|eukprot:CAMPEP_0206212338 /NCGR_PEP_ID=MMETSP0047_2-20121206/507_1 /ASSEMBLY_ACC=CAM_ASM_000192 /TAXON_ID=195065 /ORGANISM="Chroomonas mesostigmatica_cf, Strain CCMP1168" /LENGTH=150 /DNA_ID=CAMNT_0053634357 /DNA_START=26 /DNA_END=478 /DNA_ORIENTATION=-